MKPCSLYWVLLHVSIVYVTLSEAQTTPRQTIEWLMINNHKGYGRKRPWPNLKYYRYHCNCLEGLRNANKDPQSGWTVSAPRFKLGSSRIRSRSANHSAAKFADRSYFDSQRFTRRNYRATKVQRGRGGTFPLLQPYPQVSRLQQAYPLICAQS
jgi:hypothetical protein